MCIHVLSANEPSPLNATHLLLNHSNNDKPLTTDKPNRSLYVSPIFNHRTSHLLIMGEAVDIRMINHW